MSWFSEKKKPKAKDLFIGIENELMSFKKGTRKRARFTEDDFNRLTRLVSRYVRLFENDIRAYDGTRFYVDAGDIIELSTTPVLINKGFASRTTDLLVRGRNRVLRATPHLEHTGYSMHWNLTSGKSSIDDFYAGVAVPFHLFGLTPLSIGMNIRNGDNRQYELLGDSLMNPAQIRSTALLLGAYSCCLDSSSRTNPLNVQELNFANYRNLGLFLPKGRYSELEVKLDGDKKSVTIQAQQYLELFYHWLRPFVYDLGQSHEIKELEGFISGVSPLEFDKFEHYHQIKRARGKRKGMYLPVRSDCEESPLNVLAEEKVGKNLPIEGALMRSLMTSKGIDIINLTWDYLHFIKESESYDTKTIRGIYDVASALRGDSLCLGKAYSSGSTAPNSIESIPLAFKMKYDGPEINNTKKPKR